MTRIAILGAGAWGTALAVTYSSRHAVALWSRDADQMAALRADRENRALLPGIALPEALSLPDSADAALADADIAIVATPVAGLRDSVRLVAAQRPELPLLWACKGLESDTGLLPHEVASAELPAGHPMGVLTGPSFAQEVAAGLPGAITLAGSSLAFAQHWVAELHHPRLRLYASDDLIGAEVCGAVKNVMAIAAGISDGLGFGLNARAALITRGLAEISRLGLALGGRRETFMGLAGMGDLILTCTGDLSRNRRVGLAVASGSTPEAAMNSLGHVAEGVATTREVARLAEQLGVDMPITQAVNAVLHKNLPAREAVEKLLSRDPKVER